MNRQEETTETRANRKTVPLRVDVNLQRQMKQPPKSLPLQTPQPQVHDPLMPDSKVWGQRVEQSLEQRAEMQNLCGKRVGTSRLLTCKTTRKQDPAGLELRPRPGHLPHCLQFRNTFQIQKKPLNLLTTMWKKTDALVDFPTKPTLTPIAGQKKGLEYQSHLPRSVIAEVVKRN